MSTTLFIEKKCKKKQVSVVRILLRWRIQYYVYATADALKRNGQITVLLLMLLGPMLLGVLAAMGTPLFTLLSGSDFLNTLMLWGGFVAVSLIWVALQKSALMGGLANQYMQSLPIPFKQRLAVDFFVLAISNGILFIPYAIAILYSLAEPFLNMTLNIVLTILWMLTIILLQLQLLHRIGFYWVSIIASVLSPISICLLDSKIIAIASAMTCITAMYVMLKKNKKVKTYHFRFKSFGLHVKSNKSTFQNLVRIYVRQLMQKENRSQQFMLLLLALLPLYVLPQVHAKSMLQTLFWLRWKEQDLFIFVSSVSISIIVMMVTNWQMQLKTRFKPQVNFLNFQGVCVKTIYRTQDVALGIIGVIVLFPTVIVITLYVGLVNGLVLSIAVFIILMLNIRLNRSPEEMHVVAKLVIFVLSIIFIRQILDYFI